MRDFIKRFFDIKFWKFIGVGVINTLIGTGVMFLLYNVAHCSYWLSSAGNYIVGSIVSYFLNKYFTFKSREKSLGLVLRFILNIAVCYGIAYGLAKPLVRTLLSAQSVKLQDNLAMLVGAGLFVILNYIGQRFFTFRDSSSDEQK